MGVQADHLDEALCVSPGLFGMNDMPGVSVGDFMAMVEDSDEFTPMNRPKIFHSDH